MGRSRCCGCSRSCNCSWRSGGRRVSSTRRLRGRSTNSSGSSSVSRRRASPSDHHSRRWARIPDRAANPVHAARRLRCTSTTRTSICWRYAVTSISDALVLTSVPARANAVAGALPALLQADAGGLSPSGGAASTTVTLLSACARGNWACRAAISACMAWACCCHCQRCSM